MVFEAHRQRQYARELLFSTVVELTTLVSLGLRPSLHAAARQMPSLPVSLASLHDKVNHTEPGVLRALVRGSAERLAPVMATLGTPASLPGWRLRVLDGNHLPASEKRLLPLRALRGAALPGHCRNRTPAQTSEGDTLKGVIFRGPLPSHFVSAQVGQAAPCSRSGPRTVLHCPFDGVTPERRAR